MENDAEPDLLPRWFTEILPPLAIFSFKNCRGWAESLELVSGHESIFCPDCWLYWIKHLPFLLSPYLLNYWLLRGEQSNLGLVTFSFFHFSILMFCMSLRTNLNALIHLSIGMICDKVLVFKFSTVTSSQQVFVKCLWCISHYYKCLGNPHWAK